MQLLLTICWKKKVSNKMAKHWGIHGKARGGFWRSKQLSKEIPGPYLHSILSLQLLFWVTRESLKHNPLKWSNDNRWLLATNRPCPTPPKPKFKLVYADFHLLYDTIHCASINDSQLSITIFYSLALNVHRSTNSCAELILIFFGVTWSNFPSNVKEFIEPHRH